MAIVQNPFEQWNDPLRGGRVIFSAKIYVGQPDTDPTVPANRLQVFYIDENEQQINLAQPLTTDSGGYIVISDTNPTKVQARVAESNYSITVLDRQDVPKWVIPNAADVSPVIDINHNQTNNRNATNAHDRIYARHFNTTVQMKAQTDAEGNTVDMSQIVGSYVRWSGHTTALDGGGNYGIVRSGAHTEDNGHIFSITSTIYVEAMLRGEPVNVNKFGVFTNMDGTTGVTNAIAYAKTIGQLVYFPGVQTLGQNYQVNAQMDITGTGLVGDGRVTSRILTNSGALPAVIQRGDGALTIYGSLKHIQIRNNGGTGHGMRIEDAPRQNVFRDVLIFGYRQGAAISIGNNTWITDMNEVFLDNCMLGLLFDRTQSIGNVGGSHVYVGGAIEGCERAIQGSLKNLSFFGTVIEGNQGIPETFANNDRVGGVCRLGIGEGPISFHDCWFEGNGLPAILTGYQATSEATATTQVTISGGRHEAEKLVWILGNTSQISLRDLNFDYTAIARNAIIWVNQIASQGVRVLVENIRYRSDFQRLYDPYTYTRLPRTVMLHDGGQVFFPANANGDIFAAAQTQLRYQRLDNVSLNLVLDNYVQGNGVVRTAY